MVLQTRALSIAAIALLVTVEAFATPTIKEGAYRVDWNRKVRDLCVDVFTNEDLAARDWQAVMALDGAICKLSAVREGKRESSWIGKCNVPGRGTVLNIEHKVSVKVHADGSFDLLTVMSGDQQATIPVHGNPLITDTGKAAKCTKEQDFFRPWR